ncbi:Wzy polymerase domain-containing protein, partial [Klebsiella aerogenes]|uniref:Wzy polymerase domain-containing protein n=1 Tax=Klebsiella aerogenes TaxID=548 RepID=UPI002FFB5E50
LSFYGGGLLGWRAWLSARRAGGYGAANGDAPGWVICALPILLHTQVEYPFYLSSVHFLVVVLLLGTASARLGAYRPRQWLVVRGLPWLLVPAGCLLGAGVMAYALTGAWVKGAAARSIQTRGG